MNISGLHGFERSGIAADMFEMSVLDRDAGEESYDGTVRGFRSDIAILSWTTCMCMLKHCFTYPWSYNCILQFWIPVAATTLISSLEKRSHPVLMTLSEAYSDRRAYETKSRYFCLKMSKLAALHQKYPKTL